MGLCCSPATVIPGERPIDSLMPTSSPKAVDLLPELIRAAYQSRRLGALEMACEELERLRARSSALIQGESRRRVSDGHRPVARSLAQARRGLRTPPESAVPSRSHSTGRRHWSFHCPNWDPDLECSRPTERGSRTELEDCGWQVERSPTPLYWRDAALPIDLQITREGKPTYCVFLVESMVLPHVEHTLVASFRALLDDPERGNAHALPLTKQPMTYRVQRSATHGSDVIARARRRRRYHPFRDRRRTSAHLYSPRRSDSG